MNEDNFPSAVATACGILAAVVYVGYQGIKTTQDYYAAAKIEYSDNAKVSCKAQDGTGYVEIGMSKIPEPVRGAVDLAIHQGLCKITHP